MKKSVFWKLGILAALAFGLNACSESTSAEDDDEPTYSSPSNAGKTSSSSVKGSCKSVTANLSTPTNLQVVKNGDNKWVLIWDYSANDDRPETSFIIESLNMSDKQPKWQTIDSTNAGVIMYNLSGESKAGKYYRVSAKDACGVSKATDMVEVAAAGSNTTSNAELAVPSNLKLENIGENLWQLSWSYTNNENRPEQGFKLQSLDLNADSPKWTDAGTTNKGVHVVKIDGTKKGGLLYHVAAKDNNGVSEYSAEITIPRVDSTSSSSDINMDLAVPTNLKLDSIGVNKYQLCWSYTDNKNRPENGFRLQSLNVTASKPAWAVIDSTNKGVRFIIIDATKQGGRYLRVAAKDAKGTSTYSAEIQVPAADTTKVAGQEVNLAVPTNLTLQELGNNEYLLSWNYTNNDKRPENGFKLQSLDFNAAKPQWSDEGTTNKGVHVYKIDATKKGGLIFHVAAYDKNGTSEYSVEISIPRVDTTSSTSSNMDLAVPTNLKLDSIGVNKYQLSWSYTDNKNRPENGFRIQRLDLTAKTPAWAAIDSTNKSVRRIIIDANKMGGYYLRVAAKDAKGTSTYSSEIQVPKADTTKVAGQEINLAVPTGLTLKELGNNEYLLSWNYTNNAKRPENGFKLQSLDFTAANPQWTDDGTTNKGVHVYRIDATKKGGLIFHVAAKDANGISEYSAEISIPRVDTTASTSSNMDLSVPTNIKLDSIGVNKYQLSWSYTDNKNRPENGFRVQRLDLTAKTPTWAAIDSTNKGVRFIIIDANKMGGYYLRVAAKDAKGTSAYSTEVQVPNADTTKVAGQEIALAVPTKLTLTTLGDNQYLLSWQYNDNEKRPENGFKLQSLDFSAANPQWTDDGTTNKGVHVYKIDGTKKGGLMFHVAAKDSKGISAYSEEITIPSISDSTGTGTIDLAVPTNLKVDSIGINKYQISWSYTNNKSRPENGFRLQILDLSVAKPAWANLDSTNKGVRLYNIDATKHGGKYVRIAAKDSKGFSEYSSEVMIPNQDTTKVAGQEIDLAVPANLSLTSLGNNEYMLSWEYTDAPKRPAKGFVLQKLVIANGNSWEDIKATVNKDVLFYKLSSDTEKYYVRVAAKDDKGISAYSNVMEVPKKGEGEDLTTPPTNLTIARIAPSVWELTWDYGVTVDNPNRKFIIQSSKLKDFKWVDIGTKIDGGLRNYYIQGRDKIETYYRMAVVNDGDTSAFSEVVQLTPEIKYRDYMALDVPQPSMKFTLSFTNALEVDKDTSTKEDVTFTNAMATYTITSNFISKYIFESEYTDTVYYEARWFNSLEHYNYYKETCEGRKHSDYCDSCYWDETFPYQEPSIRKGVYSSDSLKSGETVYEYCMATSNYNPSDHYKLFVSTTPEDEWNRILYTEVDMSSCLESHVRSICGYYVQLRIVWTDKNGETDWSEWTQPYNVSDISGADQLCDAGH